MGALTYDSKRLSFSRPSSAKRYGSALRSSTTGERSSVYAIKCYKIVCYKMVRERNLEVHCSLRKWSSTYLFQLETFAFLLRDMRYTISEPYLVFSNVVPGYRIEVYDPPYRNIIMQVSSHGFSAHYCSPCCFGRWRPQFQLNGELCKLIDRLAVNCAVHSFRGNEQGPQVRSFFYVKFKLDIVLCEF